MQAQEFHDRVAEASGTDDAERATRAVLTALAQALPADEARDLAAQLPDPLQDIVQHGAGQHAQMERDTFLARVAELAGTDADAAERLTRAVLVTLQDAVSFGNVADSVMSLPPGIADLVGTRPGS